MILYKGWQLSELGQYLERNGSERFQLFANSMVLGLFLEDMEKKTENHTKLSKQQLQQYVNGKWASMKLTHSPEQLGLVCSSVQTAFERFLSVIPVKNVPVVGGIDTVNEKVEFKPTSPKRPRVLLHVPSSPKPLQPLSLSTRTKFCIFLNGLQVLNGNPVRSPSGRVLFSGLS